MKKKIDTLIFIFGQEKLLNVEKHLLKVLCDLLEKDDIESIRKIVYESEV